MNGNAPSHRVAEFEVQTTTRAHQEWLLEIYAGRVISYGFDPTADKPYYVRVDTTEDGLA